MPDRRALAMGLLAALISNPAKAAEPFDALLAKYVQPGGTGPNRVAYAAWAANRTDRVALEQVIEGLAGAPFTQLPRGGQFAAWANLYNAATLKVVLDAYPITSIREVKSKGAGFDPKALLGPWREKRVRVGGRSLSLDDIEHGIMRPTFKDPRVHYAVNCAAVGCPNLPLRAWRAETLEADLDAAARAFLASPRGLAVTDRGLRLSSIYDWYGSDFGDETGLRAHLAAYCPPAAREAVKTLRIAGYGYDWSLNDARATRT